MEPTAGILTIDGTNCHNETWHAFKQAGAKAEIVHLNTLIKGYDPAQPKRKKISLQDYDILVIPGGFSYGDDISAGKVFATDLEYFLGEELRKFVNAGKPIIGICNGFQVLVKYGLLPKIDGEIKQTTTLTDNENQNFECRWVRLVNYQANKDKCIWTRGIEYLDLPVAHGEGRFEASKEVCSELFAKDLVVFRYADLNNRPTKKFPDNPNQSRLEIAAICDETGLIFGLMPHPERYNLPENHHLSHLQEILSREYVDRTNPVVRERIRQIGLLPKQGLGLKIFENAVNYVKENKK